MIETMKPKSSTLFHFTKSIDHLKSILVNGFYPRYSLEDATYLNVDYIGYPMVCFCDIPISRISEHTAFYGDYGLGMTKEWGLRNGVSPLIYTPPSGVIPDLANFLARVDLEAETEEHEEIRQQLSEHFSRFAPLIKPIRGSMLIGDKFIDKDFYQENEWRFVPDPFLMSFGRDEFEETRDERNMEMEEFVLKFTPEDVKYIFVKTDAEIPSIFDYIQNNMGNFSLNDIKILSSRITSIETISDDV